MLAKFEYETYLIHMFQQTIRYLSSNLQKLNSAEQKFIPALTKYYDTYVAINDRPRLLNLVKEHLVSLLRMRERTRHIV